MTSFEPGFQVVSDVGRGVIRMTFNGFWNAVTADAFALDLQSAMSRLERAGHRQGSFLYLADFRNGSIQSAVTVERFQAFAATAGVKARRIAVLVSSVLQKKQTQRMAEGHHQYRFFLPGEEEAAEEWLFEA